MTRATKKPCVVRLTPVEIDHLLTLLDDALVDGSYYGNKQQYWKRHGRVTRALVAAKLGPRVTL